jgi:hypothetical protein
MIINFKKNTILLPEKAKIAQNGGHNIDVISVHRLK